MTAARQAPGTGLGDWSEAGMRHAEGGFWKYSRLRKVSTPSSVYARQGAPRLQIISSEFSIINPCLLERALSLFSIKRSAIVHLTPLTPRVDSRKYNPDK